MGALEPLEGHPYDELSTARVAGFLPSSRRPVPPYSTVASTIGYRFPVLAMDLFSAHGPHDKGVS
jgi:hypothetical protein